ncbi:hypothetical protein CJP72_05510 [Citrobacter sp. NCU1]|nr:hypothetical protein [Citrobacter sp. NCU1]
MGIYPAVSTANARQRRDAAKKRLAQGIEPDARRNRQKVKCAKLSATTHALFPDADEKERIIPCKILNLKKCHQHAQF